MKQGANIGLQVDPVNDTKRSQPLTGSLKID